jgi:DNA replication regulator SLD3
MLLPRSDLPLSALDIVASAKAHAQSRFYEAHVKILELEDRMGNQPMVLIARLDDARTLYAVERESHGLYVLCQLGSWVNIQQLRTAAVAWKHESSRTSDGQDNIIQEPSLSTTVPEVKFSKKKRLAIEAIQSLVKRPTSNLLADPESITPESIPPAIPIPEVQQCNSQSMVDETISPPTASEMFDTVRTQYFEALYLSKVSSLSHI